MHQDYFHSASGYRLQKTLRTSIPFSGVGLHSGLRSDIFLHPAGPNHGIVFQRRDTLTKALIPARFESVFSTSLATSLTSRESAECKVATVEHLCAALYALGVTNVLVEVQGPEVPILDGSAKPFIEAILDGGIDAQPWSRPTLRILKPGKIFQDGAICELLPRERMRLTLSIDFPHPAIGVQAFGLDVTPGAVRDQIGAARTFGFLKDVEMLKKHDLARGASLENVLAFDAEGVLNADGLRFPDECVRHKLLDALGDLALCGSWIEGEFVSFRGGHKIHLALLKALEQQSTHWKIDPAEPLSPPVSLRDRVAVLS